MEKQIPDFKDEAEEFEFWSTADSTEYFDWSRARSVKFVHLKPSANLITPMDSSISSSSGAELQE